MEFVVLIELPSIESVILSQRIGRRFRVSTANQRKKLASLVRQMDNNADGQLSRAELSQHLSMDRELVRTEAISTTSSYPGCFKRSIACASR